MNEIEMIFNRQYELFKETVSGKNTLTVIECAEFMNVSIDEIYELINKPNTDFPYLKVGTKVYINKDILNEWLEKGPENRQ